MALFLKEPRYTLGFLGFFTEPRWGKRILLGGAVISGIGMLAAIASGISFEPNNRGFQALFLIASAWLLILGVMRFFWTGAMWMFTQVFDWIASAVPSTASSMELLKRVYWILIEVFLSTAFLATLIVAVLVALGYLPLSKKADKESRGANSAAHTATRT